MAKIKTTQRAALIKAFFAPDTSLRDFKPEFDCLSDADKDELCRLIVDGIRDGTIIGIELADDE